MSEPECRPDHAPSGAELDRWARQAASRFGLPADRVDDVVQEAVLRFLIYSGDSQIGPIRNPRAWLRTVARRLAFKVLGEYRTVQPIDAVLPLIAARRVVAQNLKIDLERALAQMCPVRRRILLRYGQGCLYREIAAEMGWPVNRVGPELARARQRFEELLAVWTC